MNRTFPQRLVSGLWLAPVLLALLANLNVVQNGFGWDDELIVPTLAVPEHWWSLFLPDSTSALSGKENVPYFRPLVSVSYLLDHRVWGDNPFGFHLSNLLAHLLNTALVFFLAKALVGEHKVRSYPLLPLLAASLFAVHPVHADAVAWIAGRNDVFCTTFMLASLIFYLRFHRTGRWTPHGLAMLAFVLALLTKETAVGLLPLFPLADYLAMPLPSDRPGRSEPADQSRTKASTAWRIALRTLVPLALVALYFLQRHVQISRPLGDAAPDRFLAVPSLLKLLGALGLYLKTLLFPYPHQPFIAALPSSIFYLIFAGLAFFFLVSVFLFVLRRRDHLQTIALAWTLTLLAPALAVAVLPVAATLAAERYLYAPSAGFLILLAGWGEKGWDRLSAAFAHASSRLRMAAGLLFLSLLSAGAATSWTRNAVWKTPVAFWEAAVENAPQAGMPHGNLGIRYVRMGRYQDAEEQFKAGIERMGSAREGIDIMVSLGELYTLQKQYPKAESFLKAALDLDPGNQDVDWHLAELYFAKSIREETITADGKRVTAYDPALFIEGETYLTQALASHQTLQLFFDAGTIYATFGKQAEAEAYYQRVLSADPHLKTQIAIMTQQRLAHLRTERNP